MGTRFQKRVKVMPGVTVNLSKSGISTSVGTRGAKMTFGHGKRRTTVGLPGTGLSHTEIETIQKNDPPTQGDENSGGGLLIFILAIVGIAAAAKALSILFR